MRLARRLLDRSKETRTPPWRLAMRIALSAARRRLPGIRSVPVSIDELGTRIYADLETPFGRSLYRYGFPEAEAHLLRLILRPGDVFVDGGAHIGIFTLLAAARVGETGRVVACEPVPENMALLEANVALNGFSWVDTHMVALGAQTGHAELFSFGGGSALGSYAPATLSGSQRLAVEVKSLDEIVAGLGRRVRLVKLDVEGAELLAMRGASLLLETKADFLLELEPQHLARQNATVADLEHLFHEAGYRAFGLQVDRSRLVLVPMVSWQRPVGNPNIFVTARQEPVPTAAGLSH